MAAPVKCTMKLQDYVAHGADVNCLALGHKSGHVLVTGGDDKKVNLWAVGKSSCIMSLTGHTMPIHCVRFSHTENQVCAGSATGALKVWDLEAAKMLKNLTGHTKSVRAIEFHPYGDFITSGSEDTSIKLWDIRRKGCIFTYKGHTMAVNSLKFSPDGQWIASGGQEGAVKLWDLRMGRLLFQFVDHAAAATSVEFHPHEFLLASASHDNTVKFWDLEHFSLVSSTPIEVPHARCLQFSTSGDCLYAAGSDVLRTHLWEPGRTVNSLTIGWGRIQDIATTNSKLVGASFFQRNVSVWLVDASQLVRFDKQDDSSPVHSPFSHGNSMRRSFNKQKPSPEAKQSLRVKTIEEADRSETDPEDEMPADIHNVSDYQAIFQPNRTLTRSPPPPITRLSPPHQCNDEDTILPVSHLMEVDNVEMTVYRQRSVSPHHPSVGSGDLITSHTTTTTEQSTRRYSFIEDSSDHEPEFPVKLSSIHHSASETSIPRVGNNLHQRTLVKLQMKASSQSQSNLVTSSSTPTQKSATKKTNKEFIQSPLSSGLDLEDFLPRSYQNKLQNSKNLPDMSESEVLSSLMRDHGPVSAILEGRDRNLQIVLSIWQSRDLKAAVDSAVTFGDAVIVDFLGVLTHIPNVWNLDICVVVLPAILDLLQSKYETHIKAGCDALRLILKNFSLLIRTNVMSGSLGRGVDICREERYDKCMKCYNVLVRIREVVVGRQQEAGGRLQGVLSHNFRELQVSLEQLDQPN